MVKNREIFHIKKTKIVFSFHPEFMSSAVKALIFIIYLIHAPLTAYTQDERDTGAISGTVTDRVTNAGLYGATVNIVDTNLVDIADGNGDYTIDNIPPGIYNLRFSIIGYQALIKTNVSVSPGRTTELLVQLEQQPVEIDAIVVKAKESYFEKDPEAEVSGRTIDAREIMNSTGSVMDIQRVVQMLPSVVSGSDQMNEIIVRGGNYGENLFVMDGIEIPNPNHFAAQGIGGGPISLLRAEFINDVSFIAGAFPARYGDKASSVMDISLRRGNREKLLTNLDMGMAGAGVTAEGPIGEKGSFLFSARKSYLDLIISDFGMTAIPRYYNLQSKVTYSLGSKHTLLWNTVYGSDSIRIEPGEDVDEEDENIDQSTNLIVSGITLKSALSRNLYSEMVLSHVRNNWETEVWDAEADRSEAFYNNKSVESETNLKYDLTCFIGKQELSGGFSLKNSRFDHDIWAEEDTIYTYDTSFASAREDTITGFDDDRTYPAWIDKNEVSTVKSAVYAQLRLNPTNRLSLRLGERYDHHSYINKGRFAHRIGGRYRLTDALSLNTSYGVHHQSPSYIMLTAHENNKKNLDYYHTRQFVLGTEWLPRPDTRITVEAYTKRYLRVPVLKEQTTPNQWDSFEGEMVNAAKGHAEGIEFYVHRKMSTSYMYILSYSFYRAFYEDPRNGEERPWDFDHRNVFTASVAKRWRMSNTGWYRDMREKLWYKALAWILPFGDEVLLSVKWRFTGGRPYTEPTYIRENHVWRVPGDATLNTERFSDYHRLDIRLDRRFYFRNWSLVAYFDVMNVYGRENIWEYSRDEYGEVDDIFQFSTFPVGGFNIEF